MNPAGRHPAGRRLAAHRQLAGDVGGERGLAHAAFLVEQRDDHGLALRAGKPGCCCCVSAAWWRLSTEARRFY
jgi:hypothetical protein